MKTQTHSPEISATIPSQSLVQFAYVEDTNNYTFEAEGSIPTMQLVNFPGDTDFTRYAMLHDGEAYRVYCMRQNSNDTLYQGAFNEETEAYEFGYDSEPVMKINGAPEGTDFSTFAMLFDEGTYWLYFLPLSGPTNVIPFIFDEDTASYERYGTGIADWPITNIPENADWSGWGMLFDGDAYRMYTWKDGTNRTQIYQAAFNREEEVYEFGYDSIPVLNITGTPPASYQSGFAMLHDGEDYRFYLQTV